MFPGPSVLTDVTLAVVLVVSAITDLRTGRIFNVVTYPAILLGFLGAVTGTGPGWTSSLAGFAAGGAAFYLMFALGWMGGGDVKLMAAVGALKGYPFILNAMFYSIFFGGVAAALILIWRGHIRDVMGDIGSLLYRVSRPGVRMAPIPPRGGAFPFGVTIALGTLTAVAIEWMR
jgi:prepilin peptidase CpaA